MSHQERDTAHLFDMLDAAQSVTECVAGRTFDDYLGDRVLRRAVEREIQILGEAARRISEVYKDEHNEIPWRSIIGLRNVLVHEYGDIDHRTLWNVATQRIPELLAVLRPLLPQIRDATDGT